MEKEWRLINLGERNWLETQAIYHALALVQDEFQTPNTLVITWPNTPLVCVGLHQVLTQSIELEYIQKQGLPIVRRGTGGGSVFLDKNQVFYQIICDKKEYPHNLRDFFEHFLMPTVNTYQDFGIPAEYSPINDILANNRKISGNGAVTYGNSRVLVGNFILSFPFKEMSKILKVPEEKFRDKIAKSLEERMGSFSFFLDEVPSKDNVVEKYLKNFQEDLEIKLIEDSLTREEEEKLQDIMRLYQEDDWLYYVEKDKRDLFQQKIKGETYFTHSSKKYPGGLLQLFIHFDKAKIEEIVLSGDFSLSPPNILEELQNSFIGLKVNQASLDNMLTNFFVSKKVDLPGITTKDIAQLIVETYSRIKK